MRLFIACLAALALLSTPATRACPPDVAPDGGGGFSFGGGYGADMCEAPAPMVAGNFGGAGYGSYGGGVMVAAPAYSTVVAAPAIRQRIVAAPAYSYGGFSGRRFGGGFRGGYGTIVAAPVVRQRIVAAPVYGTVVAAPVVAVPVRAPGPIRGAISGFRAGLRNRLNGF